MRTDYTVASYERVVFTPDSYASAISRRHRFYLRRLVKRAYPYRRPIQHDFACGTGRAIRILHGLVRGANGYDSSAPMLARAADSRTVASLHLVEADGEVPEPAAADAPVLVTIFRLLPHADERVRERAIAFAAKALRNYDAGLLVVENHGNRRHLRHRSPWFEELDHVEIAELLDRHGFTVVEKRGFSLFHQGWYGRRWLRLLANAIDNLVARTGWGSAWAVNVVYVARRTR
ncbi:MAG TPA: class I SAM-dependent methyltransferase [Candidatus Limnocylindrales bacterium]|nr:class I SAM-dependent methyltransferase [Candidatus Limnocylindrales bacterium]